MTPDPRPTPPPELREQWQSESPFTVVSLEREDYMIDRAAHWAADQQLEACCQALYDRFAPAGLETAEAAVQMRDWLRAAMRPQPSIKAQALKKLEEMQNGWIADQGEFNLIRAALELVPEGSAVTPAAAAPGDRPLWELMQDAAAEAEDGVSDMEALGYAAELRVAADWLERQGAGYEEFFTPQRAATWLRAEAERAEAQQ